MTGGADQKVGEGTDELFFVDEEKQVAVGTASEDLLKLSVKFGAPPDGYGYGSFEHRKHLAVFWFKYGESPKRSSRF